MTTPAAPDRADPLDRLRIAGTRVATAGRALWREDRWAVLAVAVASLVATLAWGGTTRPMGDSEAYRTAGRIVTTGWDQLVERTPGYPLVLWLTGSLRGETVALFVTQLAMHALSVLLVVHVARSLGLPRRARLLVAVLLVLPPPMVKVVYAGSEALSELLVVVSLWLFVRWWERRSTATLVALGVVLGALAWVRPTFQLLWAPAAVAMWVLAGRRGVRTRLRAATAVALPAALLVAVLVVGNGVRFGSWGTTPMFGWLLGSRTSAFVQELPASEPLRPVLVEERDRRLLLGAETDAENYLFGIRDEVAETTGLEGVALDRRVLELNLGLIAAHPFDYLVAVTDSAAAYVQIDAEPAASGPGRLGGWLQSLTHLLLMAAFAVPLVTVPGLVLRGDLDRRTVAALGWCALVALYVAAVSCLVQTGSPRLRAPTDALLVLAMVAGWVHVRRAWRAGARVAGGPAEPADPAPPDGRLPG